MRSVLFSRIAATVGPDQKLRELNALRDHLLAAVTYFERKPDLGQSEERLRQLGRPKLCLRSSGAGCIEKISRNFREGHAEDTIGGYLPEIIRDVFGLRSRRPLVRIQCGAPDSR